MPCFFSNSQNGNALWFILIVVALFGALAATLSRNTGVVNQAGDVEQARVQATALLRYSTAIQTAVQKMLLAGISESELDFEDIGDDYENTSCTLDECKVFDTNGGGIPYRSLSSVLGNDTSLDWVISAQNFIYLAGCDDEDSSCTDILMIAPAIPRTVCMQINTIQGITNTDGSPPQIGAMLTDEVFDGSFSAAVNMYALGDTNTATEATEVQGANAACVEVSDTYYFYQLLLAR